MIRRAALSITLMMALAGAVYAATAAGRWQGVMHINGVNLKVGYTLDVKGDTLTGTMSFTDQGEEFPVLGGRVKGDSVVFTVDPGGPVTLRERGRVAGDTLYLTANFGGATDEVPVTLLRMP